MAKAVMPMIIPMSNAEAKRLYGGADGIIDDTERAMMKYDVDGNGNFTISEVKAIISDLAYQKQKSKNLLRALVGVVAMFVFFSGILLCLVFAANEASKESHINGGAMTSLDGNVVITADPESFEDMRAFLYLNWDQLNKLQHVDFSTECESDTLTENFMRVTKIERTGSSSMKVYGDGCSIYITPSDMSVTCSSILHEETETKEICTEGNSRDRVLWRGAWGGRYAGGWGSFS